MNESFSSALVAIDACAAAPATMNLAGLPLDFSTPGSNTGTVKSKLAKIVPMEVLTPASPSDLPPLGELVADEPSWHYPPATTAGEGAALVPLEYSIEWLTCAVASRLDAVMVG